MSTRSQTNPPNRNQTYSPNRNQPNPSPKKAGVGTRIKGIFETAHGIGESIRGRMLGAIDDLTFSGSAESKSRHADLAHRGRTEAETGMAHIYGYADPNVYREELSRMPNSTTATFGSARTAGTGHGGPSQDGYYSRGSRVDSEYGADDGHGQPAVQGYGQQQPAVDQNTQMGPAANGRGGLFHRTPQNAGPERMKRDIPPELPPKRQTQATDDNQRGQTYQ